MTEETIKKICYTKEEVVAMVAAGLEEARGIETEVMPLVQQAKGYIPRI